MVVFHAGTAIKKNEGEEGVVTSGGRVLAVVGLAQGIDDAQKTAYDSIKKISFDGMQYRNDIASRACRCVQGYGSPIQLSQTSRFLCGARKQSFLLTCPRSKVPRKSSKLLQCMRSNILMVTGKGCSVL